MLKLQAPEVTIIIINIYSNSSSVAAWDLVDKLISTYRAHQQDAQGKPYHVICAGDWNAHHPIWDEPRNSHLFTDQALDRAEHLLTIIGKHQLKMALPAYVPTLRAFSTRNYTCVDNMFCSDELISSFVKCIVDHAAQPPRTDHFPIVSVINISPPRNEFEP